MDGTKTQTRRLSKQTYKVGRIYGASRRRYQKSQAYIQILNAFPQRLFNVTEEEAKAEGFNNLTEFLEWMTKNQGYFIPWQTVNAYEFHKTEKANLEVI
jgi:hypothetical protein